MTLETFKQYAKHKDGTYVAYQMSKESRDLLDHFVEMNLGLTERIDPESYHITIIYSRTPVPSAEQFAGPITAVGNSAGYEVFPTKTGDRCLVMRVQSTQAETFNKHLNAMGATSDFPDYKPHVTICYTYTGSDDVAELPVPQFPLYFDEVHVAPLDPQFIPGNK